MANMLDKGDEVGFGGPRGYDVLTMAATANDTLIAEAGRRLERRVRIFCHANAAEPIEASVDRETFAQVFEEACAGAAGS